MKKNKIESICRAGGMRPVKRDKFDGAEIFIADGFSEWPHQNYRRLGLGPDVFIGGCYVTLWWVSKGEEDLDIGQPLFFERYHDGGYTETSKQLARINTANETAKAYLEKRKKVRLDA